MNRHCSFRGPVPLVVDMDGSLLMTDSLWECFWAQAARRPWLLFCAPFWLARGRLYFKTRIAQLGPPPEMPLRQEVLEYCRRVREAGRPCILATASPLSVAQVVADRCAFFDEVFGSSDAVNLKGNVKAEFLCERFGRGHFDYIGNSMADLPVWSVARTAIVIGSESLATRVREINPHCDRIPVKEPDLKDILDLWRVRQWIKNLLIFFPVILSHDFTVHSFGLAVLAFFSLSCMASAIYTYNDICDITSDRMHPVKCFRPFASCSIPIQSAFLFFFIPFCISIAIALLLPTTFFMLLFLYLFVTLMYSSWLKRLLVLDVLTLTVLYLLRVGMGCAAVSTDCSQWVLGFLGFLFLGLALIKRIGGLVTAVPQVPMGEQAMPGRAYLPIDLPLLESLSISCGVASCIVLVFYVDSIKASSLYSQPFWLWGECFLLLWGYIRLAIRVVRGQVADDPVSAVCKDKTYGLMAILAIFLFILAL
ncbi:UbiA family prenyltransferase [uncultured Desulfovibrio sp.]|uniref:UbiA family prenyltransferase n=1 Tax=uncultured Desulfovibrio sp. TaxID=167968 RepID=UPI0025F387C9|nr:UbiA family prenyltransferase [uncultured Desulfovibrio sp.]